MIWIGDLWNTKPVLIKGAIPINDDPSNWFLMNCFMMSIKQLLLKNKLKGGEELKRKL